MVRCRAAASNHEGGLTALAAWLFGTKPQGELLRPLPAGTLVVEVMRDT